MFLFVFGESAALFSFNVFSSVTGTDWEAILFLSGREQPIKFLEKRYPPPEYMLV